MDAAPPENSISIAETQTLMLNSEFFFSILPKDARTMILSYCLRIPPHVDDPEHLKHTKEILLNPCVGIVEDMCVAPDGCFVMCALRHVYVFNQQGRCVWAFRSASQMEACTVSTDWTIYLSVGERESVYAVKPSRIITRTFTSNMLRRPEAIALNTDESKLYVVSKGAHCVCVFDTATCESLATLEVKNPRGVAVLASGHVAISSMSGGSVALEPVVDVYDESGRHINYIPLWLYVRTIGLGLAADRAGNLYIEEIHSAGDRGVIIVSAITSKLIAFFGDVRGLRGIALCPDGTVARWDPKAMRLFRSSG